MATSTPPVALSGLASGLDTSTMIQQLMAIQQQPLTRIQSNINVEGARQQALRDVNTRLQNLQTAAEALSDVGTWADTQTVDSSDSAHVSATRTGGAAAGGYEVDVTQLAGADQLTQGTSLSAATAADVLHLKVGSGTQLDVQVAAGDSLQTIADKINGSTGTPVYATVINSQLVLSGKTTGAANTIQATSDGTLASDLGFTETLVAQDAQFTVNNVSYSRSTNLVTDAIAGVTLTLKGKTSAGPASITVGAPAADTTAITSKVQAFVDQYNSTLDFVYGKLNEQRVANPQSDSDREKGLLNSDPGLEALVSNMREAMSDLIGDPTSALNQLAQAGVSTGAATTGSTINQDAVEGKLTFDSSKLNDLLASNFEGVKALFTNATGSYATEGVAQRLNTLLDAQTSSDGIMASRISGEDTIINELKSQQADLQTQLDLKQQQLQQMFTNMETALAQAQSQGSQLSQQLAQLG